jgi:predicted nucleic acid-binding protein
MTARFFIDTNVLLYAGSNAEADQPKRQVARQVLAQGEIGFSAQVLQEFYVAAVTKERLKMTHDEAITVLAALGAFPVCPVTRELVLAAIGLKVQFGLSYWDAAILAAAKQLGCHTVYSEDMNHGQDYDGVRVLNPFLGVPAPSVPTE